MTIKKEIYCGFDIAEFNRVRDALDSVGIKHTYKVVDLVIPSCMMGKLAGTRTVLDKNAPTKQYYVYVSKDDFETAEIAVRNK